MDDTSVIYDALQKIQDATGRISRSLYDDANLRTEVSSLKGEISILTSENIVLRAQRDDASARWYRAIGSPATPDEIGKIPTYGELCAEVETLRAKWASVPIDAIADMFAYTWGEDDRDDVPDFVTTIEAWMDVMFPAAN